MVEIEEVLATWQRGSTRDGKYGKKEIVSRQSRRSRDSSYPGVSLFLNIPSGFLSDRHRAPMGKFKSGSASGCLVERNVVRVVEKV